MLLVEGAMLPSVRRIEGAGFPVSITPFSLVHVTRGELALRGDPDRPRLLPGALLALRAGTPVELSAPRPDAEALLLQASPEWVAQVRALFGAAGTDPDVEPLAYEMAGSELARHAGRLLLAAYVELDPCSEAEPTAPAFERMGRLADLVGIGLGMTGALAAARTAAASRASSWRAGFERALEELETAELDGFSLAVLAERIGVSRRQASRILKQELGVSFSEYLAALRIERAKKLLSTTNDPITDVALETGWQSLSHFNTIFRRRVGVTPSLYRARAAANVIPLAEVCESA
jgi:AraC-like DNA-binding protein